MNDPVVSVWNLDTSQQLAAVLTMVDDQATMQQFLRDVMTEKEVIEISARLEAARMLSRGEKYVDIIEKTKLSSRTVARINEWLQGGCGGYAKAIGLLDEHHTHTSPARAE